MECQRALIPPQTHGDTPPLKKIESGLLQETHLPVADFCRMRKLWVGKTYGSAAVKGKAGVLILIHKNLPCDIESSTQDEEGHLLTVHLRVSSKDLVVTNVYAPNSPTKSLFQTVTSHLAPSLQPPPPNRR